MITIHKFVLEITDSQYVDLPADARPLHLGEQDGRLCLWASVETSSGTVCRHVRVVGTGHPMDDIHDDNFCYLGTVQMASGLVWHAFACRGAQPLGEL